MISVRKWPKRRLAQLEKLRLLLIYVRSLNSGSHAMTKAIACGKTADALLSSNLNTGEPDFIQFLISEAHVPVNPLDAFCPVCKQAPGLSCRMDSLRRSPRQAAKDRADTHHERIRNAQRNAESAS